MNGAQSGNAVAEKANERKDAGNGKCTQPERSVSI